MKKRINELTPFSQVMALILLGGVSFVLIMIISSLIVSSLYPQIPTNDISVLYEKFPVQFMALYYLPFQVGFLLTPGLIYVWLTGDSSPKYFGYKGIKWVFWSFLLFLVVFCLLPFFSDINESIAQYLGVYEDLIRQKILSDEQLVKLFGEKASTISFIVALILIGVLTGIAEELAFRRFLFRHMLINTNKYWMSVLVSAFVFALLHFNYIQFIPLMAFGIVLALMYQVSGSIWPGVIVHALNNMLNVYWLRFNSFPKWMDSVDPKITIPSTILLMGLIWYKYLRK